MLLPDLMSSVGRKKGPRLLVTHGHSKGVEGRVGPELADEVAGPGEKTFVGKQLIMLHAGCDAGKMCGSNEFVVFRNDGN